VTKFQLKIFLKAAYELTLVFLQFFIIGLHFFRWKFIPEKQIIQVSSFSYFLGFLIIIIAFIILLISIKDLGRNLSPFPRPINKGNLVTTGIYRFTRHPMYNSLIFISFGVFIIKLPLLPEQLWCHPVQIQKLKLFVLRIFLSQDLFHRDLKLSL